MADDKDDKKPAPSWLGRPIHSEDHATDLERQSALNEFVHGMPREKAEEEAHKGYRQEHHAKAAAHHYTQMKSARAAGDADVSKKHAEMYSQHIKAMDKDPWGATPPEVEKHIGKIQEGDAPQFKAHPADQQLTHEKKIEKAERINHQGRVPAYLTQQPLPVARERARRMDQAHIHGIVDGGRKGTGEPMGVLQRLRSISKRKPTMKTEMEKGVQGITDPPSTQPNLEQLKRRTVK